MLGQKKLSQYAGWLTFALAMVVYYMSADRTGSLWDCGEFILGAYKLQVVHPPGAPLFMVLGRIFTLFAELFSNNPSDIAFAVNLMSGVSTAFAAAFVSWSVSDLAKLAFNRQEETEGSAQGRNIAIAVAGLVAGLCTAFSTSIWFSAVEGEVYALSTFFTAMTIWAGIKWYVKEDTLKNDRWLVFTLFSAGLSVGVHLLSLLALPAIGLLFYFKKYKKHNLIGAGAALFGGVLAMVFIQKFIVVGIPSLWWTFEKPMVNGLGLPFHSGLLMTILVLGGLAYALLLFAKKNNHRYLHIFTIAAILNVIAFSLIGVIMVRANADTPVNMNTPSDVVRLLPYLNREQYGERPLLFGPHFDATPHKQNIEPRYGRVGDRYEHVDDKVSHEYKAKDKLFFPRIQDNSPNRKQIYRMWWGKDKGTPNQAFNMKFMFKYQLGWMYWRYLMWNFVGRQNGDQGYFPWDKASGHWKSGISFVDNAKLFNHDLLPDKYKNNKSNNTYYFIPFILGLIGLFWYASKRPKEFMFMLLLFIVTGIGIIIYSNQPPNEPRERDYVLVGSFLTFAMWIGLAVPALYEMIRNKTNGSMVAVGSSLICLAAPALLLFQNFDDHSRKDIQGSRDYASNFLNSVDKNAIIFTYGDNDTYPLWYAQEVENIRPDVRVVNLSLIAVDWYISKLMSKVNDSPAINMTITRENYRGKNRGIVPFAENSNIIPLQDALRTVNSDAKLPGYSSRIKGYWPSTRLMIPPNPQKAQELDMIGSNNPENMVPIITDQSKKQFTYKDETAILDLIGSNIWERPIYFSVTVENSKVQGLNDYTQLEGLALRLVPFKNKSNTNRGIAYSGSVNTEKAYENIMTKWKWGNFDKKDLFVDDSYGASINAIRTAMTRVCEALLAEGKTEKSAALAKKYFEAFPNFNFPYSYEVLPFIETLIKTKNFDEAKKHIQIAMEEARQNLDFLTSLDNKTIDNSYTFRTDIQKYTIVTQSIANWVRDENLKDLKPTFDQKLGVFINQMPKR